MQRIKNSLFGLAMLGLSSLAYPAEMDVSWDLPTARTDGSALDPSEIKGFYIYTQKDGVLQTPVFVEGPQVTVNIPGLEIGTYVIWATSVDQQDNESADSNMFVLELVEKDNPPIEPIRIEIQVTVGSEENVMVIYK